MSVDITSLLNSTSTTSVTEVDTSTEMTSDDFYELLVAEVTNQDPMDPVSNQDLVLQLMQLGNTSSLSDVSESLQELSDSTTEMYEEYENLLSSLSTYSSLGSASAMIGKTITYTDDESGEELSGTVSQVNVKDGSTYLSVGSDDVLLTAVTSIS